MNDPLAPLAELPGVSEAVDDARTAVDRLLGHRVLRRRSAEVSAESALRGARASAELEGTPADLEDVRSGTTNAPAIQGALRVSAELGSLVDTWRHAPRQVLARLHVLAAADTVPADELGRPRGDGTAPPDPHGLGPPPGPQEVSARLDALARVLSGRTAAPAPVVAAIVHGELAALRPFGWGNGLVARAAERLILVATGLDPKSLAVPEVGHLDQREQYATAMGAYIGGGTDGMVSWVRHCSAALAAGARESLAICEAIKRG